MSLFSAPSSAAYDPVEAALAEDVGAGDLTCRYFVGPERQGRAVIRAKQAGVLAGGQPAAAAFQRVDARAQPLLLREDGAAVRPGDEVLSVTGPVAGLLTAERVALNFMQRLSGVATLTRRFVEAVAGTSARILDTRKTTPGLRTLEKAAVLAGGGTNHRMGLYDMVMVKDNHLAAETRLPQLQEAIRRFHREQPGLRLEIEADTLEQVREFLTLEGVQVILLDNMTPAQMAEAVHLGRGRVLFEASGGVTLPGVREIAESGVDFISVGALTHSAPALDFSLELIEA